MKLNIEYNRETVIPLPSNVFTDRLKDVFAYHECLYKSKKGNIEKLCDSIRQNMSRYKEDNHSFRLEKWMVVLDKNIITIRFGEVGAPQIIIKEIKQNGRSKVFKNL